MIRRERGQSGFAAIAAIVILTVLAGMGAFMVSFSNTQQLNAAQDMQSTRAYWAARAGLDWSIGKINSDPTVCPTLPPTSVDTGSSFSLAISCTPNRYQEGGSALTVFVVRSVASAGTAGSIGYVERSVSASYEVAQ